MSNQIVRTPSSTSASAPPLWLTGGGAMGELIRELDWSQTPLGPLESWPSALKTTTNLLLHSRHPMFLWWGPELIQLYNDAYVPSFGVGKHPRALGQRGRECWQEIWPIIGPQIDDVWLHGKPCWHEDALVPIFRNGAIGDAYWTYGYSPVFDDAGAIVGVLVVCTETTGHVQATQQLRKSEAEFRTLAESIPQLAWSARPDGYLDWYNRRWYEYTGTTFAQMQGWGWQSVHDPSLVEDVVRRWQAALVAGLDFEMEFPLRRSDGVFRWHLTRAVPLRDEAGRIVRWFGTNTDIDDTKRAEAERSRLLATAQTERARAEIANRAKDEFLATASHELRTPLNAILGWARLLRGGQLDPSGYLRGVETIERNARAQVRLIEDILDGSRIITGKLHLEVRSLDLTQLVQAALDAVRPAAEAKSIALTVELDPEAARMTGDPERLQQVVWNLANNAIKFTPKGGAVHVQLARVGADVELLVADTGQGIDLDFLPHVFERFRQAEGSTTRRHGGLGLGLALVRHLIEAHGGTVRAESAGPGLGATFGVRIPVHAVFKKHPDSVRPTPTPNEELSLTAATLSGVSVLVVDDEADARDLVATVLRANGAEVTTAPSVERALALLAESLPMVLVSDIAMPEFDGYELIRRVRSLGPDGKELAAVALTAYARQEDRRRALEAGFHSHVAKPVEPAELVRVVASMAQLARRPTASIEPPRADPFS